MRISNESMNDLWDPDVILMSMGEYSGGASRKRKNDGPTENGPERKKKFKGQESGQESGAVDEPTKKRKVCSTYIMLL